MEIVGYVLIFVLGSLVQFLWLSRGKRNSPISALALMVIAAGGVVVLGWGALGGRPDRVWVGACGKRWPAHAAVASLARLWAVQMIAHSAFTFSIPR
ncbi:MAG TPA: hypothetical protein VKZ79_06770, partial [Alphaproteobacteria bacterium]|nr:hypothetical protein [Alphaproteobacteria bacterium]